MSAPARFPQSSRRTPAVRPLIVALMLTSVLPAGAQPAIPAGSPAPRGAVEQGRLRADRMRYLAREQVYIASGNVVLVLGAIQIRADAIRYEQGPQVATAEGRVAVTQREMQLTAPSLRYEAKTEIAEATGGAVLDQKGTTVRAPRMRFLIREDVTVASGGVEAVHGDATITAPHLRHDGRSGEVTAEGGVTVSQPGTKITGRRMVAHLPSRRADVREDVTLIRVTRSSPPQTPAPAAQGSPPPPGVSSPTQAAEETTTITAGRIVFRWDVNEGEATEKVVAKQKDRTGWADRMTYSEPTNQLVMIGNVIVEQLSGESLVREGVASTPRSAEERQALTSTTRLTCTRLVMTLRERDMVADGPLKVTQKGRWATGSRGTYTEATRRVVVTGNVNMQEADGRRLKADRVIISLLQEVFEAEGNVETQFTIRPSPTRRP